jgi:cytochrome c-type biogenesis protein
MGAFFTLLGPFGLGLLAMISPCVLPMYPGFLAYLATQAKSPAAQRQTRWLGVFVLAGVLTSMLLVGMTLAFVQVALGQFMVIVLPLLYGLIILLGVVLVLGINPLERLPRLSVPQVRNPLVHSFLYGMLYGPMTLPCTGPLLIGAFAYSAASVQSVLEILAYVIAFGLGFGTPLLLLTLIPNRICLTAVRWMAAHHRPVMLAAGLLLIVVGGSGLVRDWALIRAYARQ